MVVMTHHDEPGGQLMGQTNSTSLDDLIKTDEAILPNELTKYLRQYSHITNEGKEVIQCSQYTPQTVIRPTV